MSRHAARTQTKSSAPSASAGPAVLRQPVVLAVNTDVRVIESSAATELYITAAPSRSEPVALQAAEVFAVIARLLQAHEAWIVEERIFASPEAQPELPAIRALAYGSKDDGVSPSYLAVPHSEAGAVAGVQVHAVCGQYRKPELLLTGDKPCGRVVCLQNRRFITLPAICTPEEKTFEAQATRTFEKAEALLQQAGADFRSIARTWWWLKDINTHYASFNKIRRQFFTKHGLLNGSLAEQPLPASTGIGVGPGNGALCGLDIVAVVGEGRQTQYFPAAGNQHSANAYGSAFSRAAKTQAPAGELLFVSGTAAINALGNTCHVGEGRAQIIDTVENVRAVIAGLAYHEKELVQAIAYCKTPAVEREWRKITPQLGWPVVTVIADVCRPNLLFEIEATAQRRA